MSDHKRSVQEAWTLAERGMLPPDEAKQALGRAVVEIGVLTLSLQAEKNKPKAAVNVN